MTKTLIERTERETGLDNALDVLIEVALFVPDKACSRIRANNAGTKVIYTDYLGREATFWAPEWTGDRPAAAAALKARAIIAKEPSL